MISRIRIEAYGESAADVEEWLHIAAQRIEDALRGRHGEEMIGQGRLEHGEQVITRTPETAPGSHMAFQGRLILHPDISSVRVLS